MGGMGRDRILGTGSLCGVMKRSGTKWLWSHNVVNVINGMELDGLKWL